MKELAHLTDDPDERSALLMEHAEAIDPDDPYFQQQAHRLNELANLRRTLPAKRQAIASELMRVHPLSATDIAEKLKVSLPTIAAAKADPRVRRMLVLNETLNHHRRGPSLESRAALLWRIALRNEESKPRIAIAAVDTLNKQTGVYKPDDQAGNQPTQINVVNFNFAAEPKPLGDIAIPAAQKARDADAIDGEFTPVTVEVPDAHE